MGVGARKTLETNLGWNFEPESLLFDEPCLRHAHPVQHVLYDWMHVFFVSGVFNITLFLVLHALSGFGITYQLIHDYVAAWNLPRRRKNVKVGDVFCKKRCESSKEAKHWKCTASEGLSTMEILAHFMASILEGCRPAEQKTHAKVFLQLVHVIELLIRSARHRVPGRDYFDAVFAFLTSFRTTYGPENMTPKFHSSVHFSFFLDKWNCLPNCFVLERKHKMPKRWAQACIHI